MGINDPYDRTGQYAGGDTGPKVGGFAHGQQPDGSYVGDRRDHAVATMVGDGYRDTRQGYGAILDGIENRISAVDRFNGRGAYGNYGVTKTGELLDKNNTLDSVVTARTREGGYQFSNWSPKNKEAYDITQAAYRGNPVKGTEGWYSQAMDVYDDYYRDVPTSLRGVAQGGTYYQNAAALTKNQSSFQNRMQEKYGALPVGTMGHVMTGPGLTAFGKQAYDPAVETVTGVAYTDELGLPMRDSIAYRDIPELESIKGVDWNDDFSFDSFTDDLGNYHEFAGFVDDPMQADAYGYATPTEQMGGWEYADGLGGNFADDIANGVTFDFVDDPMSPGQYGPATASFEDDPMQSTGYGPATASFGNYDPMGPEAYGPEEASSFEDPFSGGQYGPATAQGYGDPLASDAYGPAYGDMDMDPMQPDAYAPPSPSWGEDPMQGGQYGPATADIPAQDDAYGTGYATPTETVMGNVDDNAWGTASYRDDLGDYAEYTGTEDPMNTQSYGPATASWGEDPMQPDAYAPETMPTSTSSIPASVTPAPARTASTTPPAQTAAFATPQARTQAPQQTPTSFGVPSRSPVQRSAPAQPSVPFGRVGGTGDPAATTMRSDRTIADNQGAYGGKDAFGPNDAFGGMGFGRSEYGGYADVVDSYNRATGDITRTVTDRYGNVVDQKSVNTGWAGGGGGWDGRPTGENSSGNAERGDGSYSESSGRNDNNPQGIL